MRKIIGILAVIALLWTGAWFVVRSIVDSRISDALTREASRGRKIACSERSISGFPFALSVSCQGFSLETQPPLRPIFIKARQAVAGLSIDDPTKLSVTFLSPLEIRPPVGEPIRLDWQNGGLVLRLSLGGISELSFLAERLRVAAPQRPMDGATIESFSLSAKRSAVRPATDAAFDIALRAKTVATPNLDPMLRNTKPADLSTDIVVTGITGLFGLPIPLAVDRWRRGGGQVDIAAFDFTKGDWQAQASGNLAIDEERRLRGRISGSARGFNFAQFQPSSRFGDISTRFGAVAGNLRVPFAFTMENGQLRMGPVKMLDLPPLY